MKTLLLNSTFEYIRFISEKKLFKLLAKQDKIDIISYWDNEYYSWGSGKALLPAVVKLKYHRPWIPKKKIFSRKGVFIRDQYQCQYCGKCLCSNEITLEHIIPRSQGGETGWKNCVSACKACNIFKKNRTPEQAGMKLLYEPTVPDNSVISDYRSNHIKHPDWMLYLK